MKMDPLPAKLTIHGLGARLVQVHDCQERHHKANQAHFKALTDDVSQIKDALKLNPGQKPTIASNTGRQSFIRTVLATGTALGAAGGFLLGYRAVVALAPSTWHWILTVNHLLLTGKF